MEFFTGQDDFSLSRERAEDLRDEECVHSEVFEGVCEDCFCQVTELDSRPKFTVGNKRISGVDYASGMVASVHGVQKTFSEKPNISNTPKAAVLEVCRLYDLVAGDAVMRGTQRLGVIAACLRQVQLSRGIIWREKKFLENFNIKQKDFSKGENLLSAAVSLIVPTLDDVIRNCCHNIGLRPEIIPVAIQFGKLFKSTHHTFIKASIFALGAGLLWTFIEMKPSVKKSVSSKLDLNLTTYSNIVGISKSLIKEIHLTAVEVKNAAKAKRDARLE